MKLPGEVRQYREALLAQYLKRARGVLHLGGHLGQEAKKYANQEKNVVWVEALPEIHRNLTNNLKQFTGQIALCALLGDKDGCQCEFHISNNMNGISSSIYTFGEYAQGHKSLWPELKLRMLESITLPMLTLDTLLKANHIPASDYNYWVIDLQGAELLALKGAETALEECEALYVEVSSVPIYVDGVRWNELNAYLDAKGFKAIWEPLLEHDDVLFLRRESNAPSVFFNSDHYIRHNQRRQEHLASLGLDLREKTVLEVGAGIGDHTSFFLDRGCSVLATEIRPENLEVLQTRFSENNRVTCLQLDMDNPIALNARFEIVYCYGLLYHLQHPMKALRFLEQHCEGLLLLETCVSDGSDFSVNTVDEPSQNITQSFYGRGCRPGRQWLWNRLNEIFPYVYDTKSQPAHDEFPLDWSNICNHKINRIVFVCSKHEITNRNLSDQLLVHYEAC